FMSTYPAKLKDGEDLKQFATGYDPARAWSDADYPRKGATCSAAAATAMACGQKTVNGAIGMDIHGKPLPNLTEMAEALGKATGVVTSVPISHATPAGFVAHNVHRNNYDQIARDMLLDSRVDVIMGCGHPQYGKGGETLSVTDNYKYVGGKETWEDLLAGRTEFRTAAPSGNNQVLDANGDGTPDPWSLVQDREGFLRLASGPAPTRVLGLAPVASTLQQDRPGDGKAPAFAAPFIVGMPTLREMTLAALNVLDGDPEGFFLMVEGGAIDWASHDNQSGRMIEEMDDFNRTVDALIEWVEVHSSWEETLLIVTGDHECGYLTGPVQQEGFNVKLPVLNHGQGTMPGMQWNHDNHTNQLIPLFARGAGSERALLFADEVDPVRGKYLNNTEIAQWINILWGTR
ncbi:MAG TPA: alkaline phosphatase, partial [Bacteroidales bacterium]|nr:alkaline phosphatase [Bacteroidales bacterium]